MFDTLLTKGFHYFNTRLSKSTSVNYHLASDLNDRIRQFGLRRAAILTDGQTDVAPLMELGIPIIGIYSFDLDIIGTKIAGKQVLPTYISSRGNRDGWIVSSVNELDGFTLNELLWQQRREHEVILQHVKHPQGTRYYSYADFFANEQKTVVQINNYFRRLYGFPFPIDIRYTLRDKEGKITKASQFILPADCIKVIRSEDFNIKDFIGIIEIEFEISKKVVPFLHYMIDYISDDFICSTHQSGLGLHPAHSRFTRGYIPTDEDKSLVVCLFQRNYAQPVEIKATLHYGNQEESSMLEKNLPPLARNNLLFFDVKRLFDNIDFAKISSPFIEIDSDVPLHRPNYYYKQQNTIGYYDTEHAGADMRNHVAGVYHNNPLISESERKKFDQYNCVCMDLKQYVFPPQMRIESLLALGNDMTYPIKDFTLDFYDHNGSLKHSFQDKIDFEKERFFNINNYLQKKGVKNFSGTLSLRPPKKEVKLPIAINAVAAYRHMDRKTMTSSTSSGGQPDNIPFYFRGGPPNYIGANCAAAVTDIFARGIYNKDFDTYYTLSYLSADKKSKMIADYEIQVVNMKGQKLCFYKKIKVHGCAFLMLSQLLEKADKDFLTEFYTVWFFSHQAHLYGQHMLFRKRDHAISVRHCYVGKFGV